MADEEKKGAKVKKGEANRGDRGPNDAEPNRGDRGPNKGDGRGDRK